MNREKIMNFVKEKFPDLDNYEAIASLILAYLSVIPITGKEVCYEAKISRTTLHKIAPKLIELGHAFKSGKQLKYKRAAIDWILNKKKAKKWED